MRVVDMVLAFASLILAMAIGAALGASIQNSMLAMLLVWWPPYAKVSRGPVLSLTQRDFVTAARAVGLSNWRVLLRHILPAIACPGADNDGLRQRHHHHRRPQLPGPGRGPAHAE